MTKIKKINPMYDKLIKKPLDRLDESKAMNRFLTPFNRGFKKLAGLAKKTKRRFPQVYDQVMSVVKSHVVTIETSKRDGKGKTDLNSLGEIFTDNLLKKLPTLNTDNWRKMIKDKPPESFLDIITKGVGSLTEESVDFTSIEPKLMFGKILIANRGEIAVRIMRAARELGVKVAVVYSDEDKNSLAVKFADESYNIGSTRSYLDPAKIIKIAKKANVDAVHPGYGFLAENAGFARMCKKNNIKFIGPKERTIQMMGDKIIARHTMKEVGVPVIPGTEGAVQDKEEAVRIAKELVYPVIVKATAGGGGKGMRIVNKEEELMPAIKSAMAEAKSSFGNKDVYIEKYFEEPRHIEFQVLADQYGNVIHLGERECSIQRRHQKLIEEAPSVALTPELRETMGEAAVKAGKAAGYEGAGTVEFLLDDKGNFFFMEMNTRIQVEHGITEMITGVDLVKEQIKVAAGAKLTLKQEDIHFRGWAIECRINAESVENDFMPCPGTITNYLPPGGPGIRVCSCSHTGYKISPHYDSMISKLMCFGKNRNEAIARMRRALEEYIIEGVDTTIPFHSVAFETEDFRHGNINTTFIERNKILDKVKKILEVKNKEELTNGKRIAVIAAAVSQYLGTEQYPMCEVDYTQKQSAWVMASRQQMLGNFYDQGRF